MSIGAVKKISGIFVLGLLLSACGDGSFSKEAIQGTWKFTSLEGSKDGKVVKAAVSQDLTKATRAEAEYIRVMKQYKEFRVEGNTMISVTTLGDEQKQTFKDDGTFDASDEDTTIRISEASATSMILEVIEADSTVKMGFTR